jgi:hypothetical protein
MNNKEKNKIEDATYKSYIFHRRASLLYFIMIGVFIITLVITIFIPSFTFSPLWPFGIVLALGAIYLKVPIYVYQKRIDLRKKIVAAEAKLIENPKQKDEIEEDIIILQTKLKMIGGDN